jgi:hypothetical protein
MFLPHIFRCIQSIAIFFSAAIEVFGLGLGMCESQRMKKKAAKLFNYSPDKKSNKRQQTGLFEWEFDGFLPFVIGYWKNFASAFTLEAAVDSRK